MGFSSWGCKELNMTDQTANLSFPGLSQEFLTTVCSAIQLYLNPMDCSLPGSSVYGIYFFHNKNIATYSFFLSKSSLSFEALKTK